MRKTRALVVLSGGQDSVTCLYWAKEHFEEVFAVTFDYNQRHRIEIDSAIKTASMAGVKWHKVVQVGPILEGKSPLTNPNENLEKYNSFEEMDSTIGNRRELTFVPMRNALFLTLAANIAEVHDIGNIVTGVCQMDNANYDDCRQTFIIAAQDYINKALGHDHRGTGEILIMPPLLNKTKAQTVEMALKLSGCWEALAYSHTSYDGTYPPTDNNHSNVLRAQGFLEAGYPDPLVIRAWHEGKMDLPNTDNYWWARNCVSSLEMDADGGVSQVPLDKLLERTTVKPVEGAVVRMGTGI